MMAIDLSGEKFFRLYVSRFAFISNTKRFWVCKCECGTKKIVSTNHLRQGRTKSCGCLRRELVSKRRKKHGQSLSNNGRPTGAYESWQGAKDRCFNKNDVRYPDWGGRGITMCREWKNSFESFFAEMGARPDGKTLDRIDVNGNYEPSNCRWADAITQARNKRK